MVTFLWLLPALPLAGSVVLAVIGRRLPRWASGLIGAGSVGLSALAAIAAAIVFWAAPPAGGSYTNTLWVWVGTDGLVSRLAFYLDPLSVVMSLVVTVVGFLIHLYSTRFMEEEEGYSRFFAWLNLFVASMLILVLADNLLLLYLGWEGVGLCSYLLIGFWYRDPANGRAARKAFVVTRIGDTAFLVGLFLIYTQLGTFRIAEVAREATARWTPGGGFAVGAALLLLGGALGKSAQLPLQTWLPDAMAGPTPVSALIHAATMVTAGVYLIARNYVLFSLAPQVLDVIAIIGALTLVLAGTSAVFQRDIKRVLAYSTMSQIGYMFLALGVGAWSAAIFHFMAHAFFKSLLFLSAGVIILGLDHEHDLYRMGGLRRRMPVVFWTMLIGGSSLAGIPLVTAGFYSKDLILWSAWSSGGGGGFVLWLAGLLGTFLTGLYIFRLIFLAFFGEEERKPSVRAGWRIYIALVTLAFLAIVGGFINAPRFLGRWMLLSPFLEGTFGPSRVQESPGWEGLFSAYASLAAFLGILAAWWWFLRRRPEEDEREIPFVPSGAGAFWRAGWDFDLLYDTFFVRPYAWLAGVFRSDPPDRIFEALARLTNWGYLGLRWTQNGRVRWYAAGLAAGTVIVVAVMVFLR